VVLNLPDMINQTAHQVELHYNARRDEIRKYDFGAIFSRYIKA
ncbi:MAG: PH domain-containing protein, partial [Methylococcaceae bacterium]|nr:PH domain-containing protein [Methylococcaceae bacterium]